MNAEVTSRLAPILERARIACEAAEQCRQRTTKIVLQSCLLMQRFEELERTMTQTHHRTSNVGNQPPVLRGWRINPLILQVRLVERCVWQLSVLRFRFCPEFLSTSGELHGSDERSPSCEQLVVWIFRVLSRRPGIWHPASFLCARDRHAIFGGKIA